ncbi:MAG: DLW-39 family protein [Actinomycetota bacterium]|nr:DLW-39 family protein [Actinomycetota bacterium]
MKKLLLLGALAGGAYAMVNKRKKTAAAEAKLWDEATGRTAPTTPVADQAPVAGSNGAVK